MSYLLFMSAANAVGLELSFILMFEMYVFVLRKQFFKANGDVLGHS